MSEPTLTDEQRKALASAWGEPWHHLAAVVAAMLADERAAREAAEAEARQHRAALAALRLRESDKALAECEQDLATAIDRAEAAEAKVRDLTAGIVALAEEPSVWVRAESIRALVDDPAAALAEVRAEARQEGAGYRVEAWDRGYAIGWRERDRQARAEAEGAGR